MIPSVFFERIVTNSWDLGYLQNTENEANLLFPLGIQKLTGFQLQGELRLPDPRYRLALHTRHVRPPHIFDLATISLEQCLSGFKLESNHILQQLLMDIS